MSTDPPSASARLKPGAIEYGFWGFLVIAIGRLGELVPGLSALPLAKIAIGFALFSLLRKWRQMPSLATGVKPIASTAKWLFVLSVLLTPFSIWRGASLEFVYQELPTLAAVTLIGYMMCRSWSFVRGTLLALVISGVILARAALSGYTGGRAATDTMYDTNDLAYILVTVFPLAVGFAINAKTTLKRLTYSAVAIGFLVAVLLTQSRGGLLGLLAAAAVMVLLPMRPPVQVSTGGQVVHNRKLTALVAAACIGILVFSQLPDDARTRLATILSLSSDYNLDPNNDTSRGQIWARGLRAAQHRPVGYGPGSFPMVDLLYGGRMMAPHNSFVQAVVEVGFVGLLLILRLFWLGWRGLSRVRRHLLARPRLANDDKEQFVFAGTLQCALAGSAVAGFFLSMAWATLLWVIFATSMAMIALSERTREGNL